MDRAWIAPSAAWTLLIISQTTKKETLLPEEILSLRVERIVRETPRGMTLLPRLVTGYLLFRLLPGRHPGRKPMSSRLPEHETPERGRHASLSDSPEDRTMAEITVLNQGKSSEALHRLRPGDLAEVTRPGIPREPVRREIC
jgi:ferredoxin-NADP reductase